MWTAAMLFFQTSLLAGYAYAHFLIGRFGAKRQMQVHGTLLALSVALLPILPNPALKPSQAGDPTFRILLVLAASIGLPYFLLSSTSPLLQAWYVRRSGGVKMPYRLFALSNFGSMLGLISFPFLVEPALSSRVQAYSWSGVYVAFALLCGFAAWISRGDLAPLAVAEKPVSPLPAAARPDAAELLLWVGLAACASTLLVAITNHLSQNVAPIPLLWVIPLALYLLSFILCFESDKIYQRWIFVPGLAVLLYYMRHYIYADSGNTHIKTVIPVFAAGLFFACMVCHGELARRRPAPRYLTLFYLMVSLGGAVGGLFVALVAPHVFRTFLELPIGMIACAVLVVIALWEVNLPKLGPWPLRLALCIGLGALAGQLASDQFYEEHGYRFSLQNLPALMKGQRPADAESGGYRLMVRNFYGALRVRDDDPSDVYAERSLTHGTINHGSQLMSEAMRYITTSYYGETSGIGRAIRAIHERGSARIGSIGLGAGVLSNYGRPGDYLRIYEINPLVPGIAQNWFSFYPHSMADKQIVMGDARLSLERQLAKQEVQNFDVLSVDAFSSDAIPIHLLTREALALYFHHLKPNGILALHISNRYLDLAPVCAAGAEYFHKEARTVSDDGEAGSYLSSSTWVLLTSDPDWFNSPAFADADITRTKVADHFRPWTDDYSNIVQILRWN